MAVIACLGRIIGVASGNDIAHKFTDNIHQDSDKFFGYHIGIGHIDQIERHIGITGGNYSGSSIVHGLVITGIGVGSNIISYCGIVFGSIGFFRFAFDNGNILR